MTESPSTVGLDAKTVETAAAAEVLEGNDDDAAAEGALLDDISAEGALLENAAEELVLGEALTSELARSREWTNAGTHASKQDNFNNIMSE